MFERGPGEGFHVAKADALAICPTAVCKRRVFWSLKGWVVFRSADDDKSGIAGAALARDAWALALDRLRKAGA